MNRDKYNDWISENDTYPKHSHTWVSKFYHRLPGSQKETLYRQFGPFPDKEEAAKFAHEYLVNFATKGFLTRWEIFPLCTPSTLP